MWAHRVRECCHFLTCSVVTDPRCLLLQMDNHQHHVPALLYALFILFNKDLTRTGLSDYGLKIQDIVPRGIYRSALQPYAAMWGIFWYVSHFFCHHAGYGCDCQPGRCFTSSSVVSPCSTTSAHHRSYHPVSIHVVLECIARTEVCVAGLW